MLTWTTSSAVSGAMTGCDALGVVAGRPRLAGALAALKYFGVPDAEWRAERYAAVKQEHLVKLMDAGEFAAYPDAIGFVLATKRQASRSRRRPRPRTPTPSCGMSRWIPTSPKGASPCSTCWMRTSPDATCRAASRTR